MTEKRETYLEMFARLSAGDHLSLYNQEDLKGVPADRIYCRAYKDGFKTAISILRGELDPEWRWTVGKVIEYLEWYIHKFR